MAGPVTVCYGKKTYCKAEPLNPWFSTLAEHFKDLRASYGRCHTIHGSCLSGITYVYRFPPIPTSYNTETLILFWKIPAARSILQAFPPSKPQHKTCDLWRENNKLSLSTLLSHAYTQPYSIFCARIRHKRSSQFRKAKSLPFAPRMY